MRKCLFERTLRQGESRLLAISGAVTKTNWVAHVTSGSTLVINMTTWKVHDNRL